MIILSSPRLKFLSWKLKITFSLLLFFVAPAAQAAHPFDVMINEIAWMGTTFSANDEWIELYNNTENSINLDGWQLASQDGTPKINLSGIILANGFYLLERTDETTVPNVPADQIYTGALGNNGENLGLYDNFGNLIDSLNCSSGWFSGDNATKQTMETLRQTQGENRGWQTSENPGGTPKFQNSAGVTAKSDTGQISAEVSQNPPEPIVEQIEITPTGNSTEAKSPQIENYPNGIIINEILPSPEGPDAEEEWIEIFNQNNFKVDLSDWQIADTAGKITTYTFSVGTKIGPQGLLVLSRPTTKITLNNDEEGLLLIQPNGNVLDSVNYQKAPLGQSYNKTENGWVWSSVLTPGSVNITSLPAVQKEEVAQSESGKELPKNQSQKQQLAAIGEQLPKTFDSLYLFLIALGLAVFLGIIILIIKRKLKDASDID